MKKRQLLFVSLLIIIATISALHSFSQTTEHKPISVFDEDGILVFRGKKYKLSFNSNIQIDLADFFGENHDLDPIGNGATFRRTRFAVKAQINSTWHGELELDFANGNFKLKDAIIRYSGIKNLELQVGNFKENFSISQNTSSKYLQFMERPMVVEALTPGHHLGFSAKYSIPIVWTSVGIFFQEISGIGESTNTANINKDYGYNEGLSYVGKIILRPFHKTNKGNLHIGGAIAYRNPKTSAGKDDWGTTRFSANNGTKINQKKYLDTDIIANTKFNLSYTVELTGHYKSLKCEAAYLADNVYVKDELTNESSTKHMNGWYLQAGYLLLGGKQQYDSSNARYNKIINGKEWGDIELSLRYEYIDLNDFSGEVYGGSARAISAGINVYINNNFKFVVNYQYNKNDRYANGCDNYLVGYDSFGIPTKDSFNIDESQGKTGVSYHTIACRFQLLF